MLWSTTASSSPDKGVQVELVAEPAAEPLDGLGRVVLAPVEPPIA
jgi:hypothetical protein